MRVTLLGTGSPDPSVTRASSGYLVEIEGELLLFDHGAGAHGNFLRTGHSATEVNTLFLSHLHSDHILDYARLVHSRWDQGAGLIPELTVHAPSDAARMSELLFAEGGVLHADINGRINAPGSLRVFQDRGGRLPRLRPAPDVRSLQDGQVIETENCKVTVREVLHQPGWIEAYGFRIETADGIVTYTGDTGPCDGVTALAKGADVLIAMCYFVSGTFKPQGRLTAMGHLEIARLAAEAGTKTLVATHLTPAFDAQEVRDQCQAEMSEIFQGTILWGEDLMLIDLPSLNVTLPRDSQ